ncbi:NADH:ubiquinone reductase, putative [Bodo saltans]|uniref:NADH:ubiquinone reductase, putative n=1 Tax=Bodo saltans TaxID=75058 RepID=A0A0S4JIG2_BODSA|nr:NADH:ubiquinone reductase, putative [Bodo saltans]|eukprot:CUG91314.1 NADH:ubiquinone reductase, putative [Bodo saltans]
MQSSSPLRGEVLSWYHTIVKSAFTVPWKSDEDAMYILSEARKLFRQNQFITDLDVIRRKIQEAEMRHTIAVHYLIPYPRPQHKGTGSMQTCGVVMRPDLDSLFDSNYNPRIGDPRTASTVLEMTGGAGNGENPVFKLEDAAELNDSDEGVTFQGSQIRPLTADRTARR